MASAWARDFSRRPSVTQEMSLSGQRSLSWLDSAIPVIPGSYDYPLSGPCLPVFPSSSPPHSASRISLGRFCFSDSTGGAGTRKPPLLNAFLGCSPGQEYGDTEHSNPTYLKYIIFPNHLNGTYVSNYREALNGVGGGHWHNFQPTTGRGTLLSLLGAHRDSGSGARTPDTCCHSLIHPDMDHCPFPEEAQSLPINNPQLAHDPT